MYNSPLRSLKTRQDWVVIGHNSNRSHESSPPPTRAVYSFQPKLKHLDYRKVRKHKMYSYDNTFEITYSPRETDLFPKFPIRKTPFSLRSKRPTTEYIDFLGTQLLYFSNKRRYK